MFSIIMIVLQCLFLHSVWVLTNSCPTWLPFVMICLFSIAFYIDLLRSPQLNVIRVPLMLGYLARVFLLIFDIYGRNIYILPGSGMDSERFYRNAIKFADKTSDITNGFIPVVGIIMRYIGHSRLYTQFLLMLCSIVTLILVDNCLALLEMPERNRKITAAITGLLPNLAMLSSIFLRESLITMLLAFSVFFFIRWWSSKSSINYILAFFAAFMASYFHSGVVSLAVGLVVVRLLADRNQKKISISFLSILFTSVLLMIFIFLYTNYSEEFFGKMLGIDSVEDISDNAVRGGSSYAMYVGDSSTVSNFIRYTPMRMIMYQFSPFFWQIRGVSDIIAMVFDSFYYIYLYYCTIREIINHKNKHRSLIILLFIICLCSVLVFGWGVTNTGTALRHRHKMAALYAVLFGLTVMPQRIDRDEKILLRRQQYHN